MKEECWNAPDCLYPTYKRKDVSEVLLSEKIAEIVNGFMAYLLPVKRGRQPYPRTT
jgi:hypothetical protein